MNPLKEAEDFCVKYGLNTDAAVDDMRAREDARMLEEFGAAKIEPMYRNTPNGIQPLGVSLVACSPDDPTRIRYPRGMNPHIIHYDDAAWFKPPVANQEGEGNVLPNVLTINPVESIMNEERVVQQEAATEEDNDQPEQRRLGKDEEWVRTGNNKKWRAPAVEKQRKKMAKASKKRNRR